MNAEDVDSQKSERVSVKWTALPQLRLRGGGTSRVESLQYYLHRLIWTTGIPFSILAREFVLEEDCKRFRANRYYKTHGLSNRAIELSYRLEQLTGVQNLRCGTFWALSNIISAGSGLGRRRRRRWCPLCYEGWSEHSYEPLIWEIELLGCCPIHSCRLENKCVTCGSYQSRARPIERRLHCEKCGDFLGKSALFPARSRFAWWADEQIEQLVEFCATPRLSPIPWSLYRDFVSKLRATVKRVGGLKGEIVAILKSIDRGAQVHTYKPTIRTLVNLCAVQGISMQEFLNAPLEAATPMLFDQWSGLRYLPFPSALQAQQAYVATCCMEDFLNKKSTYLPSISLLLKRFRVQSFIVIDGNRKLFNAYQKKQEKLSSISASTKLRRAYLCALGMIGEGGVDSDSALNGFAAKVAKYAEVDMTCAILATEAANNVKLTQSEERVQHYKMLLPLDRAVDWLLDKRAKNTYRNY